jgi:hypothetical protein
MQRTVLAILVAIGVAGAATGTAEARRSGDDGGPGRPPVASQRGGMLPTHGICDCFDFAVPVVGARLATMQPDGSGPHLHFEQ